MTKLQRRTLLVAILASFVVFLDGSVVNVALPAISKNLGGGLATQQWVVDAYLLTLGALILIAGSLSDLFGRKRVLMYGLLGFGMASLLCAVAPTNTVLIIARAVQGVAGALLVPSSLAIIIAGFSGAAQGKAIGSWTAWTGISFLVGPLLGGALVDLASWRLIFAINVIPIILTLWLVKGLPQENTQKTARVDFVGAFLCAVGLAGSVYALIEHQHYGWGSPWIALPLALGVLALVAFIEYERKHTDPMLPLELFKVRNFSVGNVATTAIYAALSVATFLIVVFVQQVGGYSAFTAGVALLPVTLIMFGLSPRFGALSGKFGPRFFMAAGPLVAAAGFLLMLNVGQHINYWTQLFPGIIVFGIGLSMTVAPLTSAVLSDIDSKRAGIGSAVNNAISRIAGLIAIAAVGIIIGNQLDVHTFRNSILAVAILLIIGGVVSWIGIVNPPKLKAQHD